MLHRVGVEDRREDSLGHGQSPAGLTVVYPGRPKRDFLAPLPVRTMSGIGPRRSCTRGIRTLGQLADADEVLLRRSRTAASCTYERGDDAPRVEQDDTVKSVSNDDVRRWTSPRAEETSGGAIATIAAKVGRRLRRKGLRGHTLACACAYDDRSVRSVQRQLPAPNDDELSHAASVPHGPTSCGAPACPSASSAWR